MSRDERIELAAQELMTTVEEVTALVKRAKAQGRRITTADAIAEGALLSDEVEEESKKSSGAQRWIGWL